MDTDVGGSRMTIRAELMVSALRLRSKSEWPSGRAHDQGATFDLRAPNTVSLRLLSTVHPALVMGVPVQGHSSVVCPHCRRR